MAKKTVYIPDELLTAAEELGVGDSVSGMFQAFLRSRLAHQYRVPSAVSAVRDLVPYFHAQDLDKSVSFYRLLGFEQIATVGGRGQEQWWCYLTSGSAALMLAAASAPVIAEEQAALLYMYSDDVHGLRRDLEQSGAEAALSYPPHMPNGELRTADPDGYVILVGQQAAAP